MAKNRKIEGYNRPSLSKFRAASMLGFRATINCGDLHMAEHSLEVFTFDTEFLSVEHVIGSYLIRSNDGLILIETGPSTVYDVLVEKIRAVGAEPADVRHVFLTHIHFDHAGGAWKFADLGAKIYVHPIGLPHLHNPERLWGSAKRIYGDAMETLWGDMQPIAKEQLIAAADGDVRDIGGVTIRTHYTPGHAVHHNAYQIGDAVFTGDVAGVRIEGGPVIPPCPPPDIDIELWKKSIQLLRDLKPARLYLTHFGEIEDVTAHLDALEIALDEVSLWMKPHYDAGRSIEDITPEFIEFSRVRLRKAGASEEQIDRNEKANPSYMSVAGLMRYWKLKEQGRL